MIDLHLRDKFDSAMGILSKSDTFTVSADTEDAFIIKTDYNGIIYDAIVLSCDVVAGWSLNIYQKHQMGMYESYISRIPSEQARSVKRWINEFIG